MFFFFKYAEAREKLYEYSITGKRQLIIGAVICDFGSLIEYVFLGFFIIIIVTLLTTLFFYFYHYDGSKMLYLMKRLPDKGELWRRCVTLPIAGAVLLVIWMNILRLFYFAIYLIFTPSQCLPL